MFYKRLLIKLYIYYNGCKCTNIICIKRREACKIDAHVVIPTVRGGFGNILEPNSLFTGNWSMYGCWNVRIKTKENKTVVNINSNNMTCVYSVKGLLGNSTVIPIKSTGVFERSLLNYLTE